MATACQVTEIPLQEVPDLIEFYRYSPEKYPFLLTTSSRTSTPGSGVKQPDNGPFDILFMEPDYHLKLDHQFRLSASDQPLSEFHNNDFLTELDRRFYQEQESDTDHEILADLPFRGGWFVFFAYEFAQQVEPGLGLSSDRPLLPIAYAARIKKALVFSHSAQKYFFITEPELDHKQAFQAFQQDLQALRLKLEKNQHHGTLSELAANIKEDSGHIFLEATARVHRYIRDGDVFQVNLSRLWQSFCQHSNHSQQAADLFCRLEKTNPAPFSGLVSFQSAMGRASIISSSPERLLRVRAKQLESRPIAGTRPRSDSPQKDQQLLDELHAHPKEQAEHIMLIDLIRNDLGRVCVPGSVRVDELMCNETYAHVHHIVSNVTGTLTDQVTPGAVIRALFPGGTITGCPKVRCMEIIAELEQQSRGAYTGSMGYLNRDGSMDLNILIRTMLLEQNTASEHEKNTQYLSFRAGAGLVYDSIAEKELMETRAKAKGILRVMQQ